MRPPQEIIKDKMNKKEIPLPTKYKYYCAEDGTIYNGDKELKGYKQQSYSKQSGYHDKWYRRYTLIMKDGSPVKYYGQRLVALVWHDLKPGQIVRHLSTDTLNNHKDAILPGTQLENMTIDRIEQGTYMDRGGV